MSEKFFGSNYSELMARWKVLRIEIERLSAGSGGAAPSLDRSTWGDPVNSPFPPVYPTGILFHQTEGGYEQVSDADAEQMVLDGEPREHFYRVVRLLVSTPEGYEGDELLPGTVNQLTEPDSETLLYIHWTANITWIDLAFHLFDDLAAWLGDASGIDTSQIDAVKAAAESLASEFAKVRRWKEAGGRKPRRFGA